MGIVQILFGLVVSISAFANTTKIVGGQIDRSPPGWMGSVQVGGQHFCGATLITSNWALTAAHCHLGWTRHRLPVDNVTVVFQTNGHNQQGRYNVRVRRAVPHPQGLEIFNANDQNVIWAAVKGYDFLLLELETPVPVSPVPLVSGTLSDFIARAPTRYPAYAIGWGTIDPGGISIGFQLKKTGALNYSSPQQCTGTASNYVHYCLESNVDNVCTGDSGGPALVKLGNSVYQIGVASFVAPKSGNAPICTPGNTINVFVNIDSARSWISQVTGRKM